METTDTPNKITIPWVAKERPYYGLKNMIRFILRKSTLIQTLKK
jgi:hypothetical protein